jgi:hypothetical protein
MDTLMEPAHLVALAWLVADSFSARSRRLRLAHSSFGSAPRRRSSESWTISCQWASSRSSFGLRRAAHPVCRFGGGAGSHRATSLRVVRQGPRATATEPCACDGRGRLFLGRSDRTRLRAYPRRRQFLARRRTGLPGRRQGEGGRCGGWLAHPRRAGGLSRSGSGPAVSDRRAPEWSSA